ncbi:hypothetical protein AB0D11_42035 [Streptomyces monashensis]|uniref:hypothetical protein n=1 Tax=Streptomyces monashensis TaxID=1678012 RepID=UPI0033F09D95
MSKRARGKHRAPGQSKTRRLAAQGTAVTALAAGLAGYGFTTAQAASAADSNTASVIKKDCVKAGPAVRFSFKPICPAEPPSKTEAAVSRGVDALMTFGVSELLRAAHTTNEHSDDPGCTGASAAHLSRKPLCPQRELTGLEKGVRNAIVGAVLPSPAKFAPAEIQTLNTMRGIGAGGAESAKKLESSIHNGSGSAEGAQKPDGTSAQSSDGPTAQASSDTSPAASDVKSRQKRDLSGDGTDPSEGQTSDPTLSGYGSGSVPGSDDAVSQSSDDMLAWFAR